MKLRKEQSFELMYEGLLDLVVVILVLMHIIGMRMQGDNVQYTFFNMAIYALLTGDYVFRLIRSKDKKQYFKQNIFDFLAILPFSTAFRIFRLIRIFKLFCRFGFRSFTVIREFLMTNSFIYIIYMTITTILLGAYGLYHFESNSNLYSFGDALWLSFVTATTVGYGDLAPITAGGRIVSAVISIMGLGFLGMLAGTIATFFINKKPKEESIIENNKKEICTKDLSDSEIDEVNNYIAYLRSKRG